MSIEKFGKFVELIIYLPSGEVLFNSTASSNEVGSPNTDRLRVDFNYKQWNRYGKSKVDIYNLHTDTQSKIASTEGLTYVVNVGIHGSEPKQLGDTMRITNVLTVKQVPNSVTSIYGYTSHKATNLDRIVSGASRKNPRLRDVIADACYNPNEGDIPTTPNFIRYPERLLNARTDSKVQFDKPLSEILDELSIQNSFTYVIDDEGFKFMYMPISLDDQNADLLRDFDKGADSQSKGLLVLEVENMRSNPILSIGALSVEVNLDPSIVATRVVNTSKFITSASGQSEDALKHAQEAIELARGFSNYQVVTVDHKGSTHTNEWGTRLTAYAPSNGVSGPIGSSK